MFSAGADIREIAALDTEAATQRRYLEDLCSGIANAKKPLLAAVEGLAVSGLVGPVIELDSITERLKVGAAEADIVMTSAVRRRLRTCVDGG